MTMSPWHRVLPGSTVVGKDGYEWHVDDVAPADSSAPRGTVKVTMSREGRGTLVGHPPAGTTVLVVSAPPEDPERAGTREAVTLLRRELGATVVDCPWCRGDAHAECLCDVNCGQKGCVNF
jgi:hypothetical protein